ncbi:MAG: Arc/MetJ family transcription regulator [Spirosomataceae bacterium]|jgi:Arc/MetJ family transcription regulator
MKVSIDLNKKHVASIMKYTGLTSKGDIVNAALKHYVEQHEKRMRENSVEDAKRNELK